MNVEDFLKKVSDNIRARREQEGWTQEDMREKGYSYRYYQKLESGEVNFGIAMLFRLAKTFKVKPEDLLK